MLPVCDQCGEEIRLGDWPFCPHQRGVNTVVADDIPGGKVFENGFAEPTTFYSHSAHRQALAERGYEIRAKHAGPDDKICPRWDAVDLDSARALVTPRAKITVTDSTETITAKDLDAPEASPS